MSVTDTTGSRRYTMAQFGRPTYHYRLRRDRRRREREELVQGRGRRVPTVAVIADPENLIRIYDHLRCHGGQAPGLDGVSYSDLGRSEIAEVCRKVCQAIKAGRYRPYPAREVRIAKRSGNGYRTLRLRIIVDRLVATALDREMTPHWDQIFLEQSFGFRPGRGVWQMLAYLDCQMVTQGCWVMATDDVRNAFDNVDLDALMAYHCRYVQDEGLLRLVETVLRGGEQTTRCRGIDQGGAYSPTALNVLLHHEHDLGVTQDPTNPVWSRYADNLAYLTKTVPAGHQARATAANLLRSTGMELKGEDGPPVDLRRGGNCQLGTDRLAQQGMPIVDLREGGLRPIGIDASAPPDGPLVHRRNSGAHLLGFDLTVQPDGSGLMFSLGSDAWQELGRNLVEAHTLSDPPEMARAAVLGWIASYGPACLLTTGMVDRVLSAASEAGFRELISPGDLTEVLGAAHGRWLALRQETWHRHGLPGGRESDTANAGPGVPIDPGEL